MSGNYNGEKEQDANQEATDRCVAKEIARGEVEAKLLPEAVTPKMRRTTRPTTTLGQEYRMLREIQKRGTPGEMPTSTTKKTDERREPTNPQSSKQSSPKYPTVRAKHQVSPFTFAPASPRPGKTARRYSLPIRHQVISDRTAASGAPSPSIRRRRHEHHDRPAGELFRHDITPNAGHSFGAQDQPSAQEVAISLTFSDDEIEEVKARAREQGPKWTTAVARRTSRQELLGRNKQPTTSQGRLLHPSIRLNMGQDRAEIKDPRRNSTGGEQENVLSDHAKTASTVKISPTQESPSSSLEQTSAHAPASKKVWVTKRQRRQSTGSSMSRPVHIAESLFCDAEDAKIGSSEMFDAKQPPPSQPKRKITGCLLQCSGENVSTMSDIDSESVDYDPSDDDDDSAYAMAMARTHLARKLAKESGGDVDEKVPTGHDGTSQGSPLSSEGNDTEAELRLSQPGAFAVQGLRNEDSFSHDSLSQNMSMYSEPGLVNTDQNTGAVVDAEVYEDVVIDGSVLVEEEVVDKKTKKRLRAMQLLILCLTLGSIALVTGSVVDFSPNSKETEKLVVGWISVGDAIFGSADEAQTLFGSLVRLNQDSSRLVTTAPGSDDGTSLNVGKTYILDYFPGVDGDGSWSVAAILEGSGPSSGAAMSLTASENTSTLAIGYPRLESGSVVEVVVEKQEAISGWEISYKIEASELGINDLSWFGHSIELSRNGTVLSVSAPLQVAQGNSVGAVHVFKQGANRTWIPKGKPVLGQATDGFFGWSMDLSGDGDTLVVGAPAVDDARGVVRVYRWNGNAWLQLGDVLDGEILYNRFGESVSLSYDGTLLAVGSRGLAIEPGQAQLYRMNDLNGWDLEQTFVGKETGEEFGSAIDLSDDGTVLAIGAPQGNYFGESAGRVEVYRRNEQKGIWEIQGGPIGSTSSQNFGASVALSRDGLFVVGGAPGTPFDESFIGAGSVHVFGQQ